MVKLKWQGYSGASDFIPSLHCSQDLGNGKAIVLNDTHNGAKVLTFKEALAYGRACKAVKAVDKLAKLKHGQRVQMGVTPWGAPISCVGHYKRRTKTNIGGHSVVSYIGDYALAHGYPAAAYQFYREARQGLKL